MPRSRLAYIDIGVKVALVVLLLLPILFPDLPQYRGKAMGGRALAYPWAIIVVPVVWFLFFRRKPYPYDVDILLALPFTIDMAGNALDLYDTIVWWDDLNHLVNWAILSAGFGLLIRRTSVRGWPIFGCIAGFGAVTAIVWEIAEYFTFIRANANEFATAYTDTLGDLTLGTTGSLIAAALVALGSRGQGLAQEPEPVAAHDAGLGGGR